MEEDAENLFTACDSMKKGYLSLEDLLRLCPTFTTEQARQVLTLLDADNDGKVSKDEFINGFQRLEIVRQSSPEGREPTTASSTSRRPRMHHINLLRRFSTEWSEFTKRSEDVFETNNQSADQKETIEELKSLISDIYKDIGDYIKHNEKVYQDYKKERQEYIEQLSELQTNVESQISRAMTANKLAEKKMYEEGKQIIHDKIETELTGLMANLQKNLEDFDSTLKRFNETKHGACENAVIEILKKDNRALEEKLQTTEADVKKIKDDLNSLIRSGLQVNYGAICHGADESNNSDSLKQLSSTLRNTNDMLYEVLDKRTSPYPILSSRCSSCSSLGSFDRRRNSFLNESFRSAGRLQSQRQQQFSPLDIVPIEADAYSLPDHVDRKPSGSRLNPKDPYGWPVSPPCCWHEKSTSCVATQTVSNPDSGIADISEPELEEKLQAKVKADVEPRESNASAPPCVDLKTEMAEHKKIIKVSDLNHPIDRTFRVMMAGDSSVGKSSIILRMVRDTFKPFMSATIGVDFHIKILPVDNQWIALELWDTAGQERFRSLCRSYFRRADAVILVYDCANVNTFLNVREWINTVEGDSSKDTKIVLCCNKIDLRKENSPASTCVSTKEGSDLAKSVSADFIEVSAKDGTNVENIALSLARYLIMKAKKESDHNQTVLIEETKPKKNCLGCG